MKRYFQFGPLCAAIDMPDTCPLPDTVALFACDEREAQVHYTIAFTEDMGGEAEKMLKESSSTLPRESLMVLSLPEGEGRILFPAGVPYPYALYRETDETHVSILADQRIAQDLRIETLFVSMLALEKREIFLDAMVLHSAYIVHEGRAILFTAPSGTGKSTQAGLWEQYRGARTINGDCSMIRKIDGVWHACGWPTCGSSQTCFDENYPIQAVVVLSQAKENSVKPLRGFQAIRPVMEQIKINMWNSVYQLRALSLIEELVTEVPVYHQACDISREAVDCLFDALNAQ